VKTKLSRIIIALLVAASLLITGTAYAGYGEPLGKSAVTTISR
jgi:hypothetical protein